MAKIGKHTGPDPAPETTASADFLRRDGTYRGVTAADLANAGLLTLDTTAADIAALGSQAAGSVGKAADAGHVHPTTGVALTANNLSDLASAATARTNLGLGAAAVASLPLSVANGGSGSGTALAASVVAQPATPTATSSASPVMMGLAVAFTPARTGIVKATLTCGVQNASSPALDTIGCRYGTGAAPAGVLAVTVSSGTGGAALFTATTPAPASGTIVYVAGTTQPGNFTAGTNYYVVTPSGDTFYLSATLNGSAIAYSSAGAGVGVAIPAAGTRWGGSG